jgi:hypothetical protein
MFSVYDPEINKYTDIKYTKRTHPHGYMVNLVSGDYSRHIGQILFDDFSKTWSGQAMGHNARYVGRGFKTRRFATEYILKQNELWPWIGELLPWHVTTNDLKNLWRSEHWGETIEQYNERLTKEQEHKKKLLEEWLKEIKK